MLELCAQQPNLARQLLVVEKCGPSPIHRPQGGDVRRLNVKLGSEVSPKICRQDAERVEKATASGGGRKGIEEAIPAALERLEALIPVSRGDPMSPLRWTAKSTRHLAQALSRSGQAVSHETVAQLLKVLGYSLQGTMKTLEGQQHPDRNAQFEYINGLTKRFLRKGWPAISVDAKKKKLIGKYRQTGREWQRQGEPDEVLVHDFIDPKVGKAIPYGIYDVGTA
jgi:hypothetical protein